MKMNEKPKSLGNRKLHPELKIPLEIYYSDLVKDTGGYVVDLYNAMMKLYLELEKRK